MVGAVLGRLLRFNGLKNARFTRRLFGQIAFETHPHIIQKGQVTPGIAKEEFLQRRYDLMWNIVQENSSKSEVIAVVPSAGKLYMAHDVPYPFRQSSDFLYLCGYQEPDSILVMIYNHCRDYFRSMLFVPKRDTLRELWDGPRTGSERASALTGCDKAYDINDFENVITSMLKHEDSFNLYYDKENSFHFSSHREYMKCFYEGQKLQQVFPIKKFIHKRRSIKSEAEIALMKRSCKLGSECMEEVMKFSRPGIDESHLEAKMDFECKLRGTEGLAYPPVVAGGDRANIIHYINNNQIIKEGELVLMDAGCDYHGYCSDITRTWPVNGRFSPAQRELYEALLEVQVHCINLCKAKYTSLNQLYMTMIFALGKQLKRVKLIDENVKDRDLPRAVSIYCPHHVSHYLGMDVHDVDSVSTDVPLAPGMIITVEPGIYVPKSCQEAPEHFRGIGMRIEDNILITSGEPINLTETCPKDPDELERKIDLIFSHDFYGR